METTLEFHLLDGSAVGNQLEYVSGYRSVPSLERRHASFGKGGVRYYDFETNV